jgi:hypothetical protein
VHASWLNQVEIYFSAVQRKALVPTISSIWAMSNNGCCPFQDHYNTTACPFD